MFQSVSGVRSTSNAIKHMHVKSYVSISHSDISGEVLTRGGGGGGGHMKEAGMLIGNFELDP